MTYIRGLLYAIILKFCVECCSYLAAKIDVMDDISRFKWNSREPILMSRVASSPKAAKRGRSLPSPWIIPLNWPQYDYPLLYHHGACNSSNHVLHKFPSLRGRVLHQPFAMPSWWHEWLQGYKWQSSRRWAWISPRQCGRRARSQWVV